MRLAAYLFNMSSRALSNTAIISSIYLFEISTSSMVSLKMATFGREDIILKMFRNIVEEIRKGNSAPIERFIYYLDRHIEVDTANHGPMALEMVAAICGDSAIKWREAEETAVSAMRSRVQFWDSVMEMIHQHRFGGTG